MSETKIHPTAVIDPSAEIGAGCEVGPYCVVGAGVVLGEGCWLQHHVSLTGPSRFGKENRFFSFCALGQRTQDLKYAAEPTHLEVGDENTFREFVTVNRGTAPGAFTRIGSRGNFLAYCHIAHDCVVGNNTTIANCTQLAGHVQVGDWATLGGFNGVHQFVKIGAHAMCGVSSVVLMDIPPYVTVGGNPLAAAGVNSEGLKRRGYSPEQIANLKRAYKTLYRSGLTLAEAKAALETEALNAPEVQVLTDFLNRSTRGIVR